MTLKKSIIIVMTLALVFGVIAPCIPVFSTEEHTHSYGEWIFDTAAGTQSQTCECGYVNTLHGTDTKVSQVDAPAVGGTHHLAANVNGDIYFFTFQGKVTDTTPYSLNLTTDVNNANIKPITLEAPVEGDTGFQLSFDNNGTTTRIYCYDVLTTGSNKGVMDTGTNTANYLNRHTFFVDEVGGQKVLRKIGNNNILVVKYNSSVGTYRMLGVPEAELSNEGVFPAMLVNIHSHSYREDVYGYDTVNHWNLCDCGSQTAAQEHSFIMDEALGYEVCVCGASKIPHECRSTDDVWYVEDDIHYQLCGECQQRIRENPHNYGDWSFDAQAGTQSMTCTDCRYVYTLYGTDTKVFKPLEITVGQSYYLAANAEGTIQFFLLEGSVADTKPYSLHVTSNPEHADLRQVTLEAPVSGDTGFQLTVLRPSDNKLLRIYCYDAGGSDGIMDTGTNANSELNKHTAYLDAETGWIRFVGNNHVLAVKFNTTTGTYRMLGLPEAELANQDVYPAMLVQLHNHSFQEDVYGYNATHHWNICACGSENAHQEHNFVMNETLGYEVCICGKDLAPHDCVSADDKWYADGDEHYQLCGICQNRINQLPHNYGQWIFDTQAGSQSQTCARCGHVSTLYGSNDKVSKVWNAEIGQQYYLVANANGTLYYFRHGSVSDTMPYSLVATDNVNHNWMLPVTVEAPVDGATGFQLTYLRPTDNQLLRIYCFDAGGSDGIMDTGTNTGNEFNKHTFVIDPETGYLRKTANHNILVAKYNETKGEWRMLGVPEEDLANEGVFPVMLANLHEHEYEQTAYESDTQGHWYPCQCGGKGAYEPHNVLHWEIIREATATENGLKTGVCTLCGAQAMKEVPPSCPDGHYYLTGNLDGKVYYFRDKTGTESVEHTAPFSMLTTTEKKKAMKVNVQWNEDANTYLLTYTTSRVLNIYMGDVNGSTVAKDGLIDLSSSATTSEDLINFYWDPINQYFYQMEGGIKYVIAFRNMVNTSTGKTQVRMLAVPETELGEAVAPLKLKVIHQHKYSQKYRFDAIAHWFECSCGAHQKEAEHRIENWQVIQKPSTSAPGKKVGNCLLCGNKITQAIPMNTANIKAPVAGRTYYLSAVLGGVRYYYRHTTGDQSVTTTMPYSLYTVTKGKSNAIKVRISGGNYNLYYGFDNYHMYINGNGVGVTSNRSKKDLVDFQWDAENKLLYQMENGQKMVMVFQIMKNNKTGAKEVRITSMPMERALIDPSVSLARLTTQAPPPDDKNQGPVMPEDATALSAYVAEPVVDEQIELRTAPLQDHSHCQQKDATVAQPSWVQPVVIWIVIVAVVALILFLLRDKAWLLRKWNLWTCICMILAAGLLLVAMLMPLKAKNNAPDLSEFTIVCDAHNLDVANDLAVTIYEDYGISLRVVEADEFYGDKGIYLDVMGINSYGGYKYSVCEKSCSCGYGIYINGSGYSLDTAISEWLMSITNTQAYPFGLTESISGYEWNTGDINMTGLGFELVDCQSKELYQGVELRELQYESFGYGEVTGYAVIVSSDADVELKVAAGAWDENTTSENPGEKHTVEEYGQMLTEDGYEVLAITNAGFYDLNTTMTYIPWGLQIVDGYVKKTPSEDNPNNTDNWFGQTADGKYVISNTAGYFETYETTIAQGVGGGRVLMKDGKPCFSTTGADYRTVVGITKTGDLIILTISSANYAFVTQVFMDMDLDVDCILNLDGGGSTTLHSLDENGELTQMICETPIEREVADAIAIVKKK